MDLLLLKLLCIVKKYSHSSNHQFVTQVLNLIKGKTWEYMYKPRTLLENDFQIKVPIIVLS